MLVVDTGPLPPLPHHTHSLGGGGGGENRSGGWSSAKVGTGVDIKDVRRCQFYCCRPSYSSDPLILVRWSGFDGCVLTSITEAEQALA